MGSTHLDVEQTVLADPQANDVPNAEPLAASEPSPVDKDSELTFDTGLFSWLQVVGSFFLFFNSWYAVFAVKYPVNRANCDKQGRHQHMGRISDIL